MQFTALALLALLSATPVEVHTLGGTVQSGSLVSLQNGRMALEVDGAAVEHAASDLLEIRPVGATAPDEFLLDRSAAVRLADGSVLHIKSCTFRDKQFTVRSELLGELPLPQSAVRSVRLAELENAVRAAWDTVQERETKSDLLVIRKMDALDFVGGVVAAVSDQGVTVLVNNREVTAPLNRVFGLVFPPPAPVRRDPACEVLLASGDRLVLKEVSVQEDRLSGVLLSGPEFAVPLAQVQRVDFGLGRVRFLTDLQEAATYAPVGLITSEDVLRLRKNMNSVGSAFVVGKKSYARGLWLHSGTTLKYRLNRDYRRLQAMAGVDRSATGCAQVAPHVQATILGDGRVLFEGKFGWDTDPLALDLDVAGVRDLELRIAPASAETIGVCEHLVFADARVIK